MPYKIRQSFNIYIKNVKGKGRGVFCEESINCGDIVEVAPTLRIPDEENLFEYYVFYGDDDNGNYLGLGFASLYNHDSNPNLGWEVQKDRIVFWAERDIPPGEELTIRYDGEYEIIFGENGEWWADDNMPIDLEINRATD